MSSEQCIPIQTTYVSNILVTLFFATIKLTKTNVKHFSIKSLNVTVPVLEK